MSPKTRPPTLAAPASTPNQARAVVQVSSGMAVLRRRGRRAVLRWRTQRFPPPALGGRGPGDLRQDLDRHAEGLMNLAQQLQAEGDLAVPEQPGILLGQAEPSGELGQGATAVVG